MHTLMAGSCLAEYCCLWTKPTLSCVNVVRWVAENSTSLSFRTPPGLPNVRSANGDFNGTMALVTDTPTLNVLLCR